VGGGAHQVFPEGWDKTFCLQFVEQKFSEIHFFGDKTYQGGNDYEIFSSEKTIGHTGNFPCSFYILRIWFIYHQQR
jgi:hydroxymethylpyrimidine pyrophosphatase-like HAD family hydrolase